MQTQKATSINLSHLCRLSKTAKGMQTQKATSINAP